MRLTGYQALTSGRLERMTGFSASALIREVRRRRVFRTMGLYIVGALRLVALAIFIGTAWEIGEMAAEGQL